jgi:hypothetical protein
MYQEEKMARDVYLKMAELYNVPIFENIAKSEERHKEAVASLLEKAGYDLSKLEQLGVGEFKDEELQNLYNTLVTAGSQSLADGLAVGKLIEETDIGDLEKYISETENSAIEQVYSHLENGSEHHLAAFEGWLNHLG